MITELCKYPIPEGFLEAEERDGYFVSAKMKRVWAVQLDMLQKLLDVCEKYGLRIWADSGTLLGAVREGGYIPWDDDIDVVMFRNDYDYLVQIASQEFSHPFFFQSMATEKRYARNHAQIRMDGTTGMLGFGGQKTTHIHQGIFIDVFPLDEVPDDSKTIELWLAEHRTKFYALDANVYFNMFHPFRSLKGMSSFDKLAGEYEKCLKRYDDGTHHRVSSLSFRYIMNKDWYSHTDYIQFEYISIPVPSDYDMILKVFYGNDYMTPVKAASDHGCFWVLDPDVDYHHYLPEQKRIFRNNKMKNRMRKVKNGLRSLFKC